MRHREVSRLEGFSDAVFGFALTLLVVSLETPKNFEDLIGLVRGLVPFALMFAMVCWIWYEHNIFFRRYGLQDAWTVFLNAVLLFVVLFYVYPLRFLTMAIFGQVLSLPNAPDMRDANGDLLMILYSAGVVAIFGVFVLLHRHAWGKRAAIDLSPADELQLKFATRGHALSAGLAIVSIALVFLMPKQPAWAGLIYFMMGPLHAWNGYSAGKAHAELRAATSTGTASTR